MRCGELSDQTQFQLPMIDVMLKLISTFKYVGY